MTAEHIITREMLFATLAETMDQLEMAQRSAQQVTEDYSKTLTANAKLREENEKLGNEIATLRNSQLGLVGELSRMQKERIDETHRRDMQFTELQADLAHARKNACMCSIGPHVDNVRIDVNSKGLAGEGNDRLIELQQKNDALHKAHQLVAQELERVRASRDTLERSQCHCVPVLETKIKTLEKHLCVLLADGQIRGEWVQSTRDLLGLK